MMRVLGLPSLPSRSLRLYRQQMSLLESPGGPGALTWR